MVFLILISLLSKCVFRPKQVDRPVQEVIVIDERNTLPSVSETLFCQPSTSRFQPLSPELAVQQPLSSIVSTAPQANTSMFGSMNSGTSSSIVESCEEQCSLEKLITLLFKGRLKLLRFCRYIVHQVMILKPAWNAC